MKQHLDVVFKISESPADSGGCVDLYNGSQIRLFGSSIQIIWDIKESLNLSYQLHFENWSPALVFVANGTYDWGAPLMSMSEDLVNYGFEAGSGLVFLHPLVAMTSNVYFRQPPSENIHITIFRPFQLPVWIALIACMLISSILVYKIHQTNEKSVLGSSNSQILVPSLLQVVLQMIQFIRGRYLNEELRSIQMSLSSNSPILTTSPRRYQYFGILVATYLGALVVTIYTAKIAAIFARNDSIVKSTDDLVKLGYTLTSFSDLHFNRLFKNPHHIRQTYASKFAGGVNATKYVIASNLSDPRYAFLTHPDGFYMNAKYALNYSHEICLVSYFASTIRTPQAMYIRKGLPFLRQRLNIKILQLVERGLNYRYQKNYNRQYEFKCFKDELGFTQLSYTHIAFAFFILIYGAVVAILIQFGMYFKSIFFKSHNQYSQKIGSVENFDTGNDVRLLPLKLSATPCHVENP